VGIASGDLDKSSRALNIGFKFFHRVFPPSRIVFHCSTRPLSPPSVSGNPSMAFVDFYQQSILFGLPSNNPDIHYAFLQGPTTRWVPDGDPAGDLEDHSVVVDIEAFIKSVLHAPADWRVRWAPIIHAVKRNPDFMEHYFQHCAHHKRKYDKPEESDYESLLLMNDAALRVAFPFTPSQGIPSTPLPLTQLVHLVDDGSSTRVLKESSSVPRLGTNGKVTRILRVYS